MWAARLGVPIDALEVAVQADYDVRGELGAVAVHLQVASCRCPPQVGMRFTELEFAGDDYRISTDQHRFGTPDAPAT